jgi:hypothetical protein
MRASARLVILLALLSGGCGPTVDLSKGLQVLDVSTGWYDGGIVEGKNKLVPSISFRLKNVSNRKLGTLQVNALFRRVAENDEWGSGFITVAGSEGLAPGQTTPPLTIRSQLGYTGTDPRQAMLENKQFVDAKVELFAKYESTQWTRLGEYPIARQLIPR